MALHTDGGAVMRSKTEIEHRTPANGTTKTELADVLDSRHAPVYSSPQTSGNGLNGVRTCADAIVAGGSERISREMAYHRYQLLIKPLMRQASSSNGKAGGNGSASAQRKDLSARWQKLRGEWLISPFFLFGSLAIILLVPEKLVKKIAAPFTKIFWDNFGKRIFDFAGAVAGFSFSSIFFLVVPVLIKLDSKGPIFYGQQRAGLNYRRRDRRQVNIQVAHDRRVGERRKEDLFGRPFTVYKFRTMRVDAEKASGAVWAQKNDPRTTRVGRVLRFIHLDELPQFFNVLCGEMSMVGPRPERPQIMVKLVEDIPQFPERLQVKPGITGIAQIYCGYDATIDDAREKLRYDLMYVENSTLKYDVEIMLKTLWMIVNGREVVKP
jgi:lipopolysaccharide/colanic/teichoic acid biosynthesis glycosyltransferase